jgi:lipopolysaccharide transport system permease protein
MEEEKHVGALGVLCRHRELILGFLKRDLKSRYQGSLMGLFWLIVQPLVMLLVYTYVFSTVMKVRVTTGEGTGDFAIYLFCGLLPWNAFSEGMNRAAGVLVEHANLVKRSVLPPEILPIYPVLSGIVNQMIGFAVLVLVLVVKAHPFGPSILLLPAILVLQFALTMGLAWIVAGVTVFVRDLGQIMGTVLTIWAFLTPIFYPPDIIPESLRPFQIFNPIFGLVQSYRILILEGALPPLGHFLSLGGCALLALVLGYRLFKRMQPAFADVI